MMGMDLNASPEPEEDEVYPEPQSEEDNVPEEVVDFNEPVEHEESAIQISRRVSHCHILSVRRGVNGYGSNILMISSPMGISQLSVIMVIK